MMTVERCIDEYAHIVQAAEVVVWFTEFHCHAPIPLTITFDGVMLFGDDHLTGDTIAIADEKTEHIR
jgi:hypothetical protein